MIVRSVRGLEIGEVLAEPSPTDIVAETHGQILRRMTLEDQLLEARLEKHRQSAFEACSAILNEHRVSAALVDVEHLFDGQGLFFYFLGEVPREVEDLTQQLAETYEATVQFRQFAKTLAEGCGPGCGTEEAKGQGGCESCSTCAVASACGALKKK